MYALYLALLFSWLLSGRSASAQVVLSKTFTTSITIDSGDTTWEGYDITVSGCTVTINGAHSFHSLVVQNVGKVTHTIGLVNGMNLNIGGNCFIDPGSSINVNGCGYTGGSLTTVASGIGAGLSDTTGGARGGGASYGGQGGTGYPGVNAGGMVYDETSLKAPMMPGSGGSGYNNANPGGNAGGVLLLTVGGIHQVDGSISADGDSAGRGGGSIYLKVGTLTGAGHIHANGGFTTDYGGGGGGGRIASLIIPVIAEVTKPQ